VPSDKWNIKANASKSFRTPNAAELSINGIHHGTFRHEMGDPNLRAEQGYQLDVVMVRHEKESQWKFSPYINYFDGYIYLRPMAQFSTLPGGGQLYRYSQHDALFTGAEMAYEFHPLPPLHTEVAVEYVHSYNLNTGLALPFTPPLQFKSKINYEWENAWQPSLGVFVRNAFQQNQTDRNEKKTPGFTTVDLFGQVRWKYLECVVQLNNIFDVKYFNHLSVYRQLNLPEPGRNISVALKFPFQAKKT
jgi:iron complex outermembrane receptor protein